MHTLATSLLVLCLSSFVFTCLGHPLLHMYLSPSLQPSWPLSVKDIFVRHGMSAAMKVSFARLRPSRNHVVKPSLGPILSPATSLVHQALPPVPSSAPLPRRHSGHHHRHGKPVVTAPFPSEEQSCDQICTEPLTASLSGSPCGCVYPMKVRLLLDVAPYAVFPVMRELESEVAAGTYLEQSQVIIMGASADSQNQGKTVVDINLVPLGEKFDNTTAILIYDRFWKNKMPLNITLFGNYVVIYISYPGIPSSPPYPNYTGSGPSGSAGDLPITANFVSKTQRMNLRTITTIALSAFVVLVVCIGAIAVVVKWRKSGRPSSAVGPAFTSSINKRSGIGSFLSSSIASSASMSLMSNMATCMLSVKTFSFAELEKATDKFSSKRILGEGGFGRVYRGSMEDGTEVAFKVLTRDNQNGDREFVAEVEMLSRLHHRNLVKLIGICIEGHTRCLVYELIRNGSVESHLHGSYDFDDIAKVAAIAAMCVHSEVTNRPFMGEVVQALKLIYNDTDETCGDYCSQKESSILGSDFKCDLVPSDSSWWNAGGTPPRLTYGQASSFITMDYSSGPLEEMESRPFSASSLAADHLSLPIRHMNRSGPLRTVRSKPAFYRLRGSMSEHWGLLSRRSRNDGYWA
uniref:Receptor-like serine/threonine-protein kinase ALE2 n=1 Tax=Populus alba TaxID=43335 RepID=A0A4U5QMX2_POPAL|nr:receptor-like serine/threonine-protein kinase ALE2 [Populus alba]